MLHIAATALSDYVSYIPHAIFFLFVVIAVRRYAAGYVYRPAESSRRTLAGKTFVLTVRPFLTLCCELNMNVDVCRTRLVRGRARAWCKRWRTSGRS